MRVVQDRTGQDGAGQGRGVDSIQDSETGQVVLVSSTGQYNCGVWVAHAMVTACLQGCLLCMEQATHHKLLPAVQRGNTPQIAASSTAWKHHQHSSNTTVLMKRLLVTCGCADEDAIVQLNTRNVLHFVGEVPQYCHQQHTLTAWQQPSALESVAGLTLQLQLQFSSKEKSLYYPSMAALTLQLQLQSNLTSTCNGCFQTPLQHHSRGCW